MILVLNCGSQSIKWKVFGENIKVVKEGKCAVLNQNKFSEILKEELAKIDPTDLRAGRTSISLIGHRVVHGKDVFKEPTKITKDNIADLEALNYLAPLHNPFNVLGIKACMEVFPNIPQIAVFDTEFYKDLPERAFTYALPEVVVKDLGFRKYGFHGISHEYVARKAAEALKRPLAKLKIISCHLGGGASITAIKNGKAIDTSMGFTPLEGLVMMTRSGNVDPGIVLELADKFGCQRAKEILNRESGIKGICGEGDMLKVLERVKAGDKNAKLAFDVFVYSIKKYIGGYFTILGGCDVLVFTGSIGAGLKITRNSICKDLDILKKIKVLVIKTDEELAIAQKILDVIK